MTGHIRRRGRESWELKYDLGADAATGKRLTRYASFKGHKRDAQIELARLIAAASKGEHVDPSKATLADFLDRWERDWAAHHLSPKTLERYGELLRKHVRPRLGHHRLQRLSALHLNELYAALLRDGRGAGRGLHPRTVGHVHRVLHRALGHALVWKLVAQNVASHVSPPRVQGSEVYTLTAAQVRGILDKLRGRAIYVVASVALATGMRRGELCALRWKDVDLDAGKLRVEQSLEYTKAGGLRFKPPKTKHGRRAIAIPPATIAELRDHWKQQQQQRLKLGLGKAPDGGLVFATWEGKPRHPVGLTKEWSMAMAQIGQPKVTLHSLRHTHASTLIASGLDLLTISRRLGHGSPTITLAVYGHLFPNTDDKAAAIMEATFAAARTE